MCEHQGKLPYVQVAAEVCCEVQVVMCWAGLKPEAEPCPACLSPAQPSPCCGLCVGLGQAPDFSSPKAQAQARAFNQFILHIRYSIIAFFPCVMWHDPTGWLPDDGIFFCFASIMPSDWQSCSMAIWADPLRMLPNYTCDSSAERSLHKRLNCASLMLLHRRGPANLTVPHDCWSQGPINAKTKKKRVFNSFCKAL